MGQLSPIIVLGVCIIVRHSGNFSAQVRGELLFVIVFHSTACDIGISTLSIILDAPPRELKASCSDIWDQ